MTNMVPNKNKNFKNHHMLNLPFNVSTVTKIDKQVLKKKLEQEY